MKTTYLRAPAYPLVTIDPYTSLWSMGDILTNDTVRHWSGKPNAVIGLAEIDGKSWRFMGVDDKEHTPAMQQTSVTFNSFSTIYTFEAAGVGLQIRFTSPLLPTDRLLLSRPVSYIQASVQALDDTRHTVSITLKVSSQLCLNEGDLCPVIRETVAMDTGLTAIRMGGIEQPVLGKSGDGICIDWGYVYLCASREAKAGECRASGLKAIFIQDDLDTAVRPETLFLLGYDDQYSITYFGEALMAYWKKEGQTIEQALSAAYAEYTVVLERCQAFDADMTAKATAAGGEKYAHLLQLALRQVLAAHKLVVDTHGELLYISKECFSNGCAATVDISYPSIPLFLLYDPELVKGMMRPVFRYAESTLWPYDFAPHDVGTYPILNGQAYSGGTDPEGQMPVEECGNLLVMAAAVAQAEDNAAFAREHRPLLDKWAQYLLQNGLDPDNQLCTDDFAGHLAHNCNLSIKAIMGLAGYARLCRQWNDTEQAELYRETAAEMAAVWLQKAANGDGSFRLAFDQPGSYSMKYNAIWDRIWGTELFPQKALDAEVASYAAHMNPYGLPLDNRADYTKSDWLLWTAALSSDPAVFEQYVNTLWLAYHKSPSRVPMTDWYSTVTSMQIAFQNRTVLGGLWIRLLFSEQ